MKSTITPLSFIIAFVVVAMSQAWSSQAGLSAPAGSTPSVHWTDTVPMEPGDTTPKKKKKKDRKEREDTSNTPRPDTFRTFKP